MGWLEDHINSGALVILDGAIGTELERRGVVMDDDVWCARAIVSDPKRYASCMSTISGPGPMSSPQTPSPPTVTRSSRRDLRRSSRPSPAVRSSLRRGPRSGRE